MPPPPVEETTGDTHASIILAEIGSLTAIAALIVVLRMFVRVVMIKKVGADDYLMLVALVCILLWDLFAMADIPRSVVASWYWPVSLARLIMVSDIIHLIYR